MSWSIEQEWKLQLANGLNILRQQCPGLSLEPKSIEFTWETHKFIQEGYNTAQKSFPRIVITF